MIKVLTLTVLFLLPLWKGTPLFAEIITIDGIVKSVDAKRRTITIVSGPKEKTLDVSSKAKIAVEGKSCPLDNLKSGSHVSLSYHDELEIVVKIEGAISSSPFTFDLQRQKCDFRIHGKQFASYVFGDKEIHRPFLANIHSLRGLPITRKYPLKKDDDHAITQPGLSLAFSELNGADFWANGGVVRHVEFIEEPTAREKMASLAVKNSYEVENLVICDEVCRITIHVEPEGVLLVWDSVFRSDKQDFHFGDSKEMGFGLRVASPLTVQNGGRMVDSYGRVNEKGVWGKQADWCQCSSASSGQQVGVVLMTDPKNFERSWFHARDYGFVVANPFGESAFTTRGKGEKLVKAGESLQLRFGIFIWDADTGKAPDVDGMYQTFLKTIGANSD